MEHKLRFFSDRLLESCPVALIGALTSCISLFCLRPMLSRMPFPANHSSTGARMPISYEIVT